MAILVTGGAGFIGSNFILDWFSFHDEEIINLDFLTYAGNLNNLIAVSKQKNYFFIKGDIRDKICLQDIFQKYPIRAVINFAAETHVDRSILGPADFIQTNIVGTFSLLESALKYWQQLNYDKKNNFRFLHISTDEVYGSLNQDDPAFVETSRYAPNSPYAASKAASDHLVRSFHHTYGLPTLITNCSNNYGPLQHSEKLIPLCIDHALRDKSLPIYGDGMQIRDWLYVKDHCSALSCVLEKGLPGETYNIGGNNQQTNLSVVKLICQILDQKKPRIDNKSYSDQITFVKDRFGHDLRYAVNFNKIQQKLGWHPSEDFVSGMFKTVDYYLLGLS